MHDSLISGILKIDNDTLIQFDDSFLKTWGEINRVEFLLQKYVRWYVFKGLIQKNLSKSCIFVGYMSEKGKESGKKGEFGMIAQWLVHQVMYREFNGSNPSGDHVFRKNDHFLHKNNDEITNKTTITT